MDFKVHQSEDAIYTVYKITGPTGKIYIGCTRRKPEVRWKNGKGYRASHPYFYADIEKYGWDAFKKEIVCEKLLQTGAENLEKFLVDFYDTCDPEKGYNVFSGGNRKGATMSAVGRERESQSSKEVYARNPEYRAMMRAYRRAEFIDHPESLEKLKESMRKLKQDPEHQRRQKEGLKKYYETHTNERRATAVICIETGEVYRSMKVAEEATGVDHSSISRVCRKKRITAGRLHWDYWLGDVKPQAEQ